jgi:protein-S-isoprenylcysteine O-methyltransferase Ste14
VLPFAAILVARLLDEERMLYDEPAGYPEYRRQVRFRLIPHVW